jgi:hypothetical protein
VGLAWRNKNLDSRIISELIFLDRDAFLIFVRWVEQQVIFIRNDSSKSRLPRATRPENKNARSLRFSDCFVTPPSISEFGEIGSDLVPFLPCPTDDFPTCVGQVFILAHCS